MNRPTPRCEPGQFGWSEARTGAPITAALADLLTIQGGVRDHDRHQTPWTSLLAWFLASFELGAEISYGYTLPEGGKIPGSSDTAPTASWIATPDGSWAEITLAADNGQHEVAEGGPRRMWHLVEQAHRT